MQGITLGGGSLNKILMPQGKGVGIHHKSGGNAVFFCFLQTFQVIGETVFPVLHEHQRAVHPGNFVKTQIAEEFGGFDLGVQKQVHIAPGVLHLHQMGDDLIQQPLPLMLGADGEAPQGTAKAAARGNNFVVTVPHGADVVQIAVPGDTLFLQQRVNLGQTPLVGRVDLGNGILTHGVPPSKNAAYIQAPAGRLSRRGTDFSEQILHSGFLSSLWMGTAPFPAKH